MPIDKRAFIAELGMLADRFGRTVSEPVVLRYYDTLSRRLTTQQFLEAARVIFDRDKFWPEPMRFVEIVRGNPEADSATAWNAIVNAATRGDHAAVNGQALVALRTAGVNFRDVQLATEPQLASLGKRFRAEYERAANNHLDAPATPQLEANA